MTISPRLKIGIIVVLLIGFFGVLNYFSKEVKNFFYLLSSPIQEIFWRAGDRISDFFEAISKIENLKKENEELKLKNQELLTENIALKELKRENEILREALKIELEKEFKLIFAQIIGKDIGQDFILINKGEKDGVREGQVVITSQKVLVGKINQVYQNFSKVLLISNQKSVFDGEISDKKIFGMVKGKGNLKIIFEFIPQEKELEKDDVVVTSALSGVFPPNLLVGKISQVIKSDLELFQEAEIQPEFNIRELDKLFIISQ